LDINESIDDTDDNDDDSMDHDMKSLIEMLPSVLETLKIHNQLSTYMKWCKLLKEGKFPLDNICYMLFLDLVEWFDKPFTSQMRYLREDTRQFWEVGYRLFKGKFIRFVTGSRNFGQIVDGSTERGFCTPQKAKINFPVPSVKTLTHNKLVPIYPGIIIDTIEHIAKYLPSNIIKIGIDGEKIARDKGKQMGDVNCWGHEPAPTLHEKQQRLEDEKVFIQETKTNVEKCDHTGTGTDKLTTTTKVYLLQKLKSIVTVVSKRIKDLRDVSLKLNFGIQKFVKLGEVTGDWRKSKYAPVVSSLKVGKYDIDQAIGKGLTLVNELGHISSTLNGAQNHYSKSGDVDMTHQLNYHQLYQNYQTQDSRYVKQRTDQWFTFRSEALVTGSTCNNALGLGRLKQQQSHYDKVVLGKPENRVFTEEQKQNMEYGTLHEIDGIATVVGRILPAFYPNVEYFEEGCVRMSLDDQQSFFVVSPDGSLKKTNGEIAMMYENKCKTQNNFSANVYYNIPKYYIPQLLCEMKAYECDLLFFTCWSEKSTTLFEVTFDDNIWASISGELHDVFVKSASKRPTKFSKNVPALRSQIDEFCKTHVNFVAEFPSCRAINVPKDDSIISNTPYAWKENYELEQSTVSVETVSAALHDCLKWLDTAYNLCRTVTTEMLVFMANDLDRVYHAEINNAHPVAYALKGPSMSNEAFGGMVEQVIGACESYGFKVLATASDGQWHKYGVRDRDNRPLTILQLQKDLWVTVRKIQKQEQLKEIRGSIRSTR